MSLPSSTVAFFRSQWATRFVDEMTFVRLTDRGSINPTTLQYDSETTPTVYTGGCLIRPSPKSVVPADFGQEGQTRIDFDVFLPHTATGLKPDDQGTVDSSETDSELVGKILLIRAVYLDSYRTKTHVACELALGGGQEV